MFGLTIEKLFVVALIAAVIIGPRRLPLYAGRLGALIRRATLFAGEAARRAEEETGVVGIRQDWRALDPRQYDPRRIIRDAWNEGEVADATASSADGMRSREDTDASAVQPDDPAPVAPSGSWVMAGSSGHPRRVWVPAEE